MSASAASTTGMSSWAMPIQSVAQKVNPCSAAIAFTLPAPTSDREPSNPCPYRAGQEGRVNADRGTSQRNCASTVPNSERRGVPSEPRRSTEPGRPAGSVR
ncbi:hypothetical protein K7G98_02655 [Saccharothrix sp. MB29]|nr:hypothetical protein [Saccharothrix sp. MB29]